MIARSLQHRFAPIAVACIAIAIFACMDAIMKSLSIAIGAYNAMLWRTIAGVILTGPLFLLTGARIPDRATLKLHIWRSLAAATSVLLFFWGLVRTPMAEGIALSFIAPLIALGLAAIFLKERIGRGAIGGSALAFAGMLVILASRAGQDSGDDALHGAIAILAAAVLYAVNLVLSRSQSQRAGAVEVAFFFNIVAMGYYSIASPWLAQLPNISLLPTIIGAAITSSVSILLLSWSYARAEAQYLIPIEYSAFIWAALLGWMVFDEPLMLLTLAGAVLIVAGCLWAARRGPTQGKDSTPMTGPEAAG
jgi:S-adenosylmethionine uptake transporter